MRNMSRHDCVAISSITKQFVIKDGKVYEKLLNDISTLLLQKSFPLPPHWKRARNISAILTPLRSRFYALMNSTSPTKMNRHFSPNLC